MSPVEQNVLVVDDDKPMRELLKDFFSSQGYKVGAYASADAILRALKSGGVVNKVVVSDIRMSPINGIELLQRIKKDFPTLPVVLFTSAGSVEQQQEVLQKGAAYYLTKPFPLAELQKIVDQALKK